MWSALLRSALLLSAGLVAACASPPEPDWTLEPAAAVVEELPDAPRELGPQEVRSFWLTAYPTPRRVEYGGRLLPLSGALRVTQDSDEFDLWLRRFGLEVGWNELGHEGYVLGVTEEDGRTIVLAGARSDTAETWLAQTLEQVTDEGDPDGARVRECRVLDEPRLPLRGNKRPRPWELFYGANHAWGAGDGDAYAGRLLTPYHHPAHPLSVTPEDVDRIVAEFQPWLERGVRRFAIKFDDTGFGMTPRTRLLFGGYPSAVRSLLTRVRLRLQALDPQATLYYLPQTYWWNDARLVAFSTGLRVAGGLPADVGLVFTGPEIVSETIDTAGLEEARGHFGLVRTKALIYDNLGREGDWGPLTGRDPSLWRQADGVFGERGTSVNRLTRLDWSWNPDGYDPEASWRRALFELAGPHGYQSLAAVCRAYRDDRPRDEVRSLIDAFAATDLMGWGGPVAQEALVAELRHDLVRLGVEAIATDGASETRATDDWTRRQRGGL